MRAYFTSSNKLFSCFNKALQWNAAFYGLYKISSTALTLFLFSYLSTDWFSAWATGNSLIFLFLLWIDAGFKKSIPRFCPLYAGTNQHRTFLVQTVALRIILLLIASPFIGYGMHRWWGHASLVHPVMGMFFAGGIATVFELIYHAHFWQKEYALLHTATLMLESSATFFLVYTQQDSQSIVQQLFLIKALGSCFLAGAALCWLPFLRTNFSSVQQLHNAPTPDHSTTQSPATLTYAFVRYSLFMWAATTLKSLSERNFLIPLFTYTLGAPCANMFKVANDAALIFQRTLLRTLGSADMSLLSYALLANGQQQLLVAFNYLVRIVIILTCCVAGVVGCITLFFYTRTTPDLMLLFGILILSYLFEITLSPYERLLEVNFNYRNLIYSYIPYCVGYTALVIALVYNCFSLLMFVFLTQVVRSISALCMVWYGKNYTSNR